jgi:hypothetical protein
MRKTSWRPVVEIAFIIFLFYANLLMGEFVRSRLGRERGLVWALRDIVTIQNFAIAVIAALIGYPIVEFLRRKL